MAASSEVTLTAEPGRETGSAAARRLRHEDKVPGVVYGQGADARPSPSCAATCAPRSPARPATTLLITLNVGGTPVLTIVRDLQRHPISES